MVIAPGENRMQEEMSLHTEVIDDVVLLVEQIRRMGLPAILDEVLGEHWVGERLSWGWTLGIWLVYLISQGDHRKLPVRAWVKGMHETLELITGFEIRDIDFTDDRLTIALSYLSDETHWHEIEGKLGRNLVRVYDLRKKTIHVDATTISGYREGGDGSLWQFGHSKDNSALRQIKLMMATLAPLGLPVALEVVAGHHADDPLYLPLIQRVHCFLGETCQLLFAGDCKMSALSTRAGIVRLGDRYLCPLALVGETASSLDAWVTRAMAMGEQNWHQVTVEDGEETITIAKGYDFIRICQDDHLCWQERVLVAYSPAHGEKQRQDLKKRIEKATKAILALTPEVGPGKRQIREESKLQAAILAVLKKHDVVGLLSCQYVRQTRQTEKFVGRGRGAENRQKEIIEQVRYQVTDVQRQEEAIAARVATLGWRAYVTNAPVAALCFEEAILEYRNEYLVERGFGRLKGRHLALAPMFVKRDDQVVGLPRFLSLAVGILTLIESTVRNQLKAQQTKIAGLYLDSSRKETDRPTAERLLQAFSHIMLTRMTLPDRITSYVTPLNPVQERILALLGFPPDLYAKLAHAVPRLDRPESLCLPCLVTGGCL
jgi:transposase